MEDKGSCVTALHRRHLCYSARQPNSGSPLHLGEHSRFFYRGLTSPPRSPSSPPRGAARPQRPVRNRSVLRNHGCAFLVSGGEEGRQGPGHRGFPWLPWRRWLPPWEGCCLGGPGRAAGPAGVSPFAFPAWEDTIWGAGIGEREGDAGTGRRLPGF